MSNSIRLATTALILGMALLVWSFIPGYGPQETVFADTEWMVVEDPNNPITGVSYRPQTDPDPDSNKSLRIVGDARNGDGEPAVMVHLRNIKPGWYTFEFARGQELETQTVQVMDKEYGLLAIIGGLLAVVAAPIAIIRKTRLVTRVGSQRVPVRGWTYLLMEPDGLSVARLQLVLLFVPAAVVYLALSFPLHEFPHIPDSIWQLLGIGGASAALSTLITPAGQTAAPTSPSQPDAPASGGDTPPQGAAGEQAAGLQTTSGAAALPVSPPSRAGTPTASTVTEPALVEVPTPSVTDFFAEGDGYGDISRYQSLVICVATAVVFVVSFFDTWQVPAIPDRVLQLLGTSLAVYLGVKGIKAVKKPQTGAQG